MVGLLDIERSVTPPRMVVAAVEGTAPARTATLHVAEELLDGGEVVLLAIKPSAWFVLFDSVRWLMVSAALLVAGLIPAFPLGGLSGQAAVQLAAALAVGRLGIAVLRWAARHYVLTNRRVMRLSGVFRPDILACPLISIRNTRVHRRLHERLFRLGTIQFFFECPPPGDADWHEIGRADKVHEQVRRAIERALDSQPHR